MLTALLSVENILDGAAHDVWSVNVEEDYHEEQRSPSAATYGTGRDAPVLPRRTPAESVLASADSVLASADEGAA